ncbi:MAG: hypothetical protein A2W91_07395 [Bacteroidetes bacterium GWF2_38_335]|nr:MAG: hypothetical protein A2W91_07395 [Bacteroidetes bacterium GWF2_38_335]OFY77152.1 MAG: hypothetical protein A2281_14630 [Bacteroidetes bacterium RIFOXYA12_FULL_38_20]HBS85044.1 hypothetical protein [Bacteroidales bacterium]
MEDNITILIEKLDGFIRKYYKNRIIKGVFLSVIIYISSLLLVSFLEYYGRFPVGVRTLIFWTTLGLYSLVFVLYLVIPMLKFYQIGKIISHKQAASIIAEHFSEVKDKLLNTLELAELATISDRSRDLIVASIQQRTMQFRNIPFTNAVNIRKNLRYLRHIGLLGVVITIILIFSPAIITEGTNRILSYNTVYVEEAPFAFELLNDSLVVEKGADIEIQVRIEGEYVPDKVSISYGGNQFFMSRGSKSVFKYKFRNINNSLGFKFESEGIRSAGYTIDVLPPPSIIDFRVIADVPEYTGEKDFELENTGDFAVPQGTNIKWMFKTSDNEELFLVFDDSLKQNASRETFDFVLKKRAMRSFNYAVSLANKYFRKKNVISYAVNVIPDIYPEIFINSLSDSVNPSVVYFQGLVNDDYGFSKLKFCYRTSEKDSVRTETIPVLKNTNSQQFYFAYDFSKLKGDNNVIEYYFQIWDNDQVNGSKSTRSGMMEFKFPSAEELKKVEQEASENVQSGLEESKRLTEEIKKDVKSLKERMIKDNLTQWEQNKLMEDIAKKQQKLESLLNQMSLENKQKNDFLNNFSEQEKEILEKQQQLEKIMDELLNDEIKDLIKEFNKMMEEFNKDKMEEITKDMKLSLDDLSEQLDRTMELMKKYDIESTIEKAAEELNKLAEEQEKLSEEVKDKKATESELQEKQQQQSDKFKEVMKDYKDALEKNKELESPMQLDKMEQEQQDVNQNFQEQKESMEQNKGNKASKSQKTNAQNLKQMAQRMQNLMNSGSCSQNSENMDDLRQIIDNLVTFSFNQEDLMGTVNKTKRGDPAIKDYNKRQAKLQDDFEIIKDSLYALAKRSPMLGSAINEKLKNIQRDMEKANENFPDQNLMEIGKSQQYVMTSANDLLLLLSEILQQMMEQANSNCNKPGDKQCSKPGNKPGSSPIPGMRQQQQGLKEQLEQMIQQMKDGQGKLDPKSTNKQLAKMIAEQEVFKDMLSDMINNSSLSPESAQKLKEIKNLVEQNERDLANKNITPTLLKRQSQIVTRLLEAENSEYQREIDKKRESKESKIENFSNPKEIFQYKSKNSKFDELLNTSSLKLYKFYDKKYKEYLLKLEE